MGCASAKHVSAVQNEEEAQKGKSYQNGDVFGDEYRIKAVEEVKYMKNGGEDDQKVAARNQENLLHIARALCVLQFCESGVSNCRPVGRLHHDETAPTPLPTMRKKLRYVA
ncbi:uncharacterized protein C1orf21 homolog isoform 4-T4 [Vipera latastei]